MPPQQTHETWLKQDTQLHPGCYPKPRLKVVYIAGPYRASTEWGVKQNIHAAELAAMHVWQLGGVALCSHANTAFFGGSCPDETWLAGDLELLRRCDAVYAIVDWMASTGASAEVALADSIGLPVFFQRNVTSERELAAFLAGD
jgi:nucleoside 2-deoxyribosyltransferase